MQPPGSQSLTVVPLTTRSMVRAETSCDFYRADAWAHRRHPCLGCALEHLEQAPGPLA
jgi:hypothetical protein